MRLRPLTEAECYARCYGERSGECVSVVRVDAGEQHREAALGRRLRELLDRGLGDEERREAA